MLLVVSFLLLSRLWSSESFQTVSLLDHATRRTTDFSLQLSSPQEAIPTTESSKQVQDIVENEKLRLTTIDENNNSIFEIIAGHTAVCLWESDMRRDAIGKDAAASSATNWIDDASAFALKQTLDRLQLKLASERIGMDLDEASSWIRWMKLFPCPAIVDLSSHFRQVINATLSSDASLEMIHQKREDFLSRIGCRMILLPSGEELQHSLSDPPASFIYGKLLYGGVTRCRLLTSSNSRRSPPRRAGVRSAVKATVKDNVPTWIMYGGPHRMYEAVDMGPAAVLEVVLLPRGKVFDPSSSSSSSAQQNMLVGGITWKPQNMFDFYLPEVALNGGEIINDDLPDNVNGYSPASLSGKDRNDALRSEFQSTVGGLQPQIDAIVRRVLDGRVIRPADEASRVAVAHHHDTTEENNSNAAADDESTRDLAVASLEAEELALLGLTPVRGLLLYGASGCGKTALSREISRALKARAPKIVSAPELLDRWVGGSEKLVRALFADAEAELASCNGDATKSALHVLVIDEIDAVFRKRTAAEDSGEATRSSVVNQILAKLDGVNAIPNVLLIGMTNRRELLDEALLRPGRLEVQIEIPLPDKEGRREVLNIHFGALRKKGRLSQPLCRAIDGVSSNSRYPASIEFDETSENAEDDAPQKGRKRAAIRRTMNQIVDVFPAFIRSSYDLAADYATGGFSGADIAGLVRCAGSIALSRARKDGGGVDELLITLDDVKQALVEVKRS